MYEQNPVIAALLLKDALRQSKETPKVLKDIAARMQLDGGQQRRMPVETAVWMTVDRDLS